MRAFKFFTVELFREAVTTAYDAGFNQTLSERALPTLTEGMYFPVIMSFDHHHARRMPRNQAIQAKHANFQIRCVVQMNAKGDICNQDVTPEFFERLPTYDPEEGVITVGRHVVPLGVEAEQTPAPMTYPWEGESLQRGRRKQEA